MSQIALDVLEDGFRHRKGPKYRRVVSAFEAGIRQGEFRPGDRVPTETELSARLPVSLGTLQKAMKSLSDSGLVIRNRRTGTYIADRKSQVDEVYVYRFRDPETGEIMMPSVRVLDVTLDETPGPWRDALGGPACVRIDRLVQVDRDPPAFSAMYIGRKHGDWLLDMPIGSLHGSSCHKLIAEKFDLPTLRMEHRVSCRRLSDRACTHLRLPADDVGLVWDVRDYSFDDASSLFQRFEMPRDHRPMELIEMRGDANHAPARNPKGGTIR